MTVGRVTMPFTGDAAGSGLRATNLTPWRNANASFFGSTPLVDESSEYEVDDRGVDATWVVQDEVPGNESLYFEVWVEFNPDACHALGSFSFEAPLVYLDGDSAPIRNDCTLGSCQGNRIQLMRELTGEPDETVEREGGEH